MSIKIEQRTDNHRSARQVPQPRSGGAPYAVVRSTKWAACGLGRVELKVRRGHAPSDEITGAQRGRSVSAGPGYAWKRTSGHHSSKHHTNIPCSLPNHTAGAALDIGLSVAELEFLWQGEGAIDLQASSASG
jgi:hypothetical protein